VNCFLCKVIPISPFAPLVLRYQNVTIIQCRYNVIPTATLEISRWDIKIVYHTPTGYFQYCRACGVLAEHTEQIYIQPFCSVGIALSKRNDLFMLLQRNTNGYIGNIPLGYKNCLSYPNGVFPILPEQLNQFIVHMNQYFATFYIKRPPCLRNSRICSMVGHVK
jgi:hypothetical protein